MPNPTRPRKNANHKPDCACTSCIARRGAKEAHTLPVGDDGTALAPLTTPKNLSNIDAPMLGQSRRARDRVAQWIAIRAQEPHLLQREIADKMGINPKTLTSLLYNATKAGWLQFDDPLEKIEFQVIPKTVDNLIEFLNQKDKTVTLETAKGTIFKSYQASKGISDAPSNVLALKIEMGDPTTPVKEITGQIVGKARSITD